MKVLKSILGIFVSRTFWSLVGILLLCLLVWALGPLIRFGAAEQAVAPLADPLVRLVVIAVILVFWLARQLLRQIRALRANRLFVGELAAQPEQISAGDSAVAEINEKFAAILERLKSSKLGHRKFLRDMPWYMIIGRPGTGKTTALKQSGLRFPLDLDDEVAGVAGTRNCDWLFTEGAVLIDTAGRYTEQQSNPDIDPAEWRGFLDLLSRHRGRRALNGVIVAVSVDELQAGSAELRGIARDIRARLTELARALEIRLPVYLLVTKADRLPGFEVFFDDLPAEAREQVWGVTFHPDEAIDSTAVDRELDALLRELGQRVAPRMGDDQNPADRAAIFRFPAEVERLADPLKSLIDLVFRRTDYEDAPWLRGFYLTSATQEGLPLDRLVGGIAAGFGLSLPSDPPRRRGPVRSYFLHDLMTAVIFREAGLGVFDPRAEERRRWAWRGALALSALALIMLGTLFLTSFLRHAGALRDQERAYRDAAAELEPFGNEQALIDPPDLVPGFEATARIRNRQTVLQASLLDVLGPSATSELETAQEAAYEHVLRQIVLPRMVATLEAAMWQNLRDPDFVYDAFKAYRMMTGEAGVRPDFLSRFWQADLPERSAIEIFPEGSRDFSQRTQLDAIALIETEPSGIEAAADLEIAARDVVCDISLAGIAFEDLLTRREVVEVPDWVPVQFIGPSGPRVLTRVSEQSFRTGGIEGAFTYNGFHEAIVPLIPDVAALAAEDIEFFAGGCPNAAPTTSAQLEEDILKLYYDRFIAEWEAFLADVRMRPLEEDTATKTLEDLSGNQSALALLLSAIAYETHLARDPDAPAAGAAEGGSGAPRIRLGPWQRFQKLFGRASRVVEVLPVGAEPEWQRDLGRRVSDHFVGIRRMVEEVDGQPPLLEDLRLAFLELFQQLEAINLSGARDQELIDAGGLPELTNAIAAQAAGLPYPVNGWAAGLAGEAAGLTQAAVIAHLNAKWQNDVLPFCTTAIRGRFPFEPSSEIDVNLRDFETLFAKDGLIDSFVTENLVAFVDTTSWTWRADIDLDDALLQPFAQARAIRDKLFPGGGGFRLDFRLTPYDLRGGAQQVVLDVDGTPLRYANDTMQPVAMTWPGPNDALRVAVTFFPLDGGGVATDTSVGSWAILRFFRQEQLSPQAGRPDQFRLTVTDSGYTAVFDLDAGSVENPYDLSIFRGFSCPQGF